jgi:hypothetical protein
MHNRLFETERKEKSNEEKDIYLGSIVNVYVHTDFGSGVGGK